VTEEYRYEGVPFPELGEGVKVKFKSADAVAIGGNWYIDAYPKLDALDIEALSAYLHHGGKQGDTPRPITVDEVMEVMPLAEAARRCIDSVFLRTHGLTFEGYLQREAERLKAELEEKAA
jgi:hypothetical protein